MKNDDEDRFSFLQQSELENFDSQNSLKHAQSASKHLNKYSEYFEGFTREKTDGVINSYLQNLNANKIVYEKKHFYSEPRILFLNEVNTSRIINLSVSLSYFTFQIMVLNIRVSVFCQCLSKISYGGAAKILIFQISENEGMIIKSIQLKARNENQLVDSDCFMPRSLSQAIKQYCFSKLFSVLQVGPKILNSFGFDMILSEKTAEFCLQKCSFTKYINEKGLSKLLRVMHSLRIIHGDIKPQNIMWSNQQQKLVFIDFGLSSALKEDVGENTFTYYFGTFGYCSQEMETLFYKKSMGYVDLYYNDVQSLKRAAQKMHLRHQTIIAPEKQQRKNRRIAVNFMLNLQLSRLIFDRNIGSVCQFLEKNHFPVFDETIDIFRELQPEKITYILLSIVQRYIENVATLKFSHNFAEGRIEKFKKWFLQLNSKMDQLGKKALTVIPTFPLLAKFIFIFFGQDVTPQTKNRSVEIEKILKGRTSISKQFCQLLVQYTSNLYTTSKKLVQIFQFVFQLMGYTNEEPTQNSQPLAFKIYQYAHKISIHLLNCHQINIFEMFSDLISSRTLKKQTICFQAVGDVWTYYLHQQNLNCLNTFSTDLNIQKKLDKKYFQLRMTKNKKTQNKVQRLEHSFISLCSKFYPTSKFYVMKDYAQITELTLYLQRNLESFGLYQRNRAQISVNYCFDVKTNLYFLLVAKVETQMNRLSSFKDMDLAFNQVELFLTHFLCFDVMQTFTLWLLLRISKSTQYVFHTNAQLFSYWLKRLLHMHLQFLPIYRQNYKTLGPKKAIPLVKLYTSFIAHFDSRLIFQHVDFLLTQKFWVEWWSDQETSLSDNLYLFKSKILLTQALGILDNKSVLLNLQCIQPHLLKMDPQVAIKALLLLLRHYFEDGDFNVCQKYIGLLFQQIPKLETDIEECFESLTFEPYVQNFFCLKPSYYFGRAFDFLQLMLRLYQKMQSSLNQKQFNLYIFLRGSVVNYLHPAIVVDITECYIQSYEKLRKRQQKYGEVFGNSIVILQMILSTLLCFKMLKQRMGLVVKLLKIVIQLVPCSSCYIKKRFTDKYVYFIAEAIRLQIIQHKTTRYMPIWQIREYRNSQFPYDQNRLSLFLSKLKKCNNKLNSGKFENEKLKQKLIQWNRNKAKTPNYFSFNLRSNYGDCFQLVLMQKFPQTPQFNN